VRALVDESRGQKSLRPSWLRRGAAWLCGVVRQMSAVRMSKLEVPNEGRRQTDGPDGNRRVRLSCIFQIIRLSLGQNKQMGTMIQAEQAKRAVSLSGFQIV
jgi:hypothetical protein